MPRTATLSRPEPLAALICLISLVLVLLMPARAEAGLFAWALEAEDTPARMWAGTEVEVPVTIRNLGNHPWTPALGDRLAYHWRSESGELLIRDGLRTRIPEVVGRGEAVELKARLRPPDEPGRYQLEWAIVREGVTWFPPPRGGPVFHVVEVEAGELGWAPVEALELPERLGPGEQISVPTRVKNTGAVPWDPARGDALAYHWWSGEGELWLRDGRRTKLPERVEPGAELTLSLEITAPSHPGPEPRRMCLELEPLRERVRWYGASKHPAAWACTIVDPDPLAWALLADATPDRLAIDDAELRVALTVQNVGTQPWPEGDRFGYRWRSRTSGELIDGPRIELPDEVEPGDVVELEATVRPPAKPGDYELVWGLVREGERWYTQRSDAAGRIISVGARRLAWGLLRADSLRRAWVNRTTTVELELQNLGTEPWSEASGDHLAYHWLDLAGQVVEQDGLRTSFAAPVQPGERVVVEAAVRGPAQPGHYRLQWELVREHERWYGPPAQIGAGQRWDPAKLERTRARWLAILVAITLGLATVLVAIALRLRPPTHPRAGVLVEQLPLLWAALAISSLVAAFHEFSGIDPWPGATWIAASGAWICVAALALARHRLRAWLCAALIVALAGLALADLVYMHYFGSIVPIVALTASHHLGEVGDSAVAELERVWGWLAVVPISGLIAAAIWPSTRPSEPEPEPSPRRRAWQRMRPRLLAAGVCLILALPALIRLGVALGGDLGKRVFSEQAMVGRFGYVNAHLFDLARTVRERGRRRNPSPAERERIEAWFGERQASVAATLDAHDIPQGLAAGHNLLLIQVEALQTWVIGLEVEGQEITPLLNRLRDEADWYPYLIDQTNQGKTSDAEYAVLNSQHPLGEGAICFLRADNEFHTLAHTLEEHGYATLSAHPYKRGFWNRAVLHPRYGFDRSLFRRELGEGQAVGWGLADGLFFERIVPELSALPQPWFGFLITLSLHHPYDEFPPNLAALELGALEGTRVGNYLEAMNYFDRSLAAMLRDLDEAGLLDHTVVALYGDHDARFELDQYPEVLTLAGIGDWDPAAFARLERVPLFVRVPPSTRAPWGEVEVVGGHVDVGPTLLFSLGIPRSRAFMGRPLIPGGESFAAYPDGSAYGGERMFVASGRGIPREGGCFEFPEGDSRPLDECVGLAKRAAEELAISRAVVDYDLHRELDGR